jgi:putative heme transporter
VPYPRDTPACRPDWAQRIFVKRLFDTKSPGSRTRMWTGQSSPNPAALTQGRRHATAIEPVLYPEAPHARCHPLAGEDGGVVTDQEANRGEPPPHSLEPRTSAQTADDAMTAATPSQSAPRQRWMSPRTKMVLQIVVSLVLLGFIFWFVFRQFADLSSVLKALRTLTWRESVILAAAAVWNLITYWIVVVVATPGLRLAQAAVLTQSTTAVANTVPAGGAVAVGLTYTMLSSWGFSKSRSTLSVVVTGIWNNFIKLGMPILALAILLLEGRSGGGRLIAAALGLAGLVAAIVIFALILRSEDFARKVGLVTQGWATALLRLVKRGPAQGWDLAVTKWRGRVIGLVQHRWLSLTLTTLLSHVSLYAVLLISLRVMDVSANQVSWAEVLAIFAFARLVTAIPLTPGGVGVVELALIAGLTRAGGENAQVVAAVLLFRLLTYVLPIAVGAGTYLFWRSNHSWRDSAPPLSVAMRSIETDNKTDNNTHTNTDTKGDTASTAVEKRTRHPQVIRRRGLDVITFGIGLGIFLLTAAMANAGLASWERTLFTAVNGLPDALQPVIWPFMQYGVFLTIPVLCVVALLLRRVRLAIGMGIAGVGVYFLARVVKEFVHRGRPEVLLDNTVVRETFAAGSLGYPSGHTAVAGALTVVVTPYLRGRWKIIPAALLVIVFLGRMYVAAHVALDLIGGAALGVAAGAIANLLVGVPTAAPRNDAPGRHRAAATPQHG